MGMSDKCHFEETDSPDVILFSAYKGFYSAKLSQNYIIHMNSYLNIPFILHLAQERLPSLIVIFM